MHSSKTHNPLNQVSFRVFLERPHANFNWCYCYSKFCFYFQFLSFWSSNKFTWFRLPRVVKALGSPLWPASQPPGFLPHRHLIPLVLGVFPRMFHTGTNKLAYICLLVHLRVSPLSYINDSIIWTALHVLSKHFYTMRISSTQSRNNHYKRVCVSLQYMCYTLKKKTTNKLLQTPSYNLLSSLAIENALCFSIICNVWYSTEWLYWNFLNFSPVIGSMGGL